MWDQSHKKLNWNPEIDFHGKIQRIQKPKIYEDSLAFGKMDGEADIFF